MDAGWRREGEKGFLRGLDLGACENRVFIENL